MKGQPARLPHCQFCEQVTFLFAWVVFSSASRCKRIRWHHPFRARQLAGLSWSKTYDFPGVVIFSGSEDITTPENGSKQFMSPIGGVVI